jgi:ferredoxin-NADP reductase
LSVDVAAHSRLDWREAVIERVEHQTKRVVGVFLRVALPPHEAGQHVDVRLSAPDGYEAQRSYSIASEPGAGLIQLVIERLEEGEVSSYFHDVAAPGDTIEVRGPIGGHFVWRAADGGPLLLVGGGSGVAPLMAIARHRATVAPLVPALLVYSARTADEFIFWDELRKADAAHAAFDLIATTTRGAKTRASDFEGRINAAMVREMLARWEHEPRHVYVCGSNHFVEAATNALIDTGIAPERIRTERYGGA